jgi:hypothetical protein
MQSLYDVPKLAKKDLDDMMRSPNETLADAFYFVNGKLVMHNKAYFSFYQ